jgi:hypothetical protein
MPAGGVGRQIDEEISAALLTSSQVAEVVIAAATKSGLSVTAVGPTQYRMTRSYRAAWVLPAAIVGVVLFGLGLLLLLVVPKRTEECLATMNDGPRGVTVRLSGVLAEAAVAQIRLDLSRVASPSVPGGAPPSRPVAAPSPFVGGAAPRRSPAPLSDAKRLGALPTIHASWTPIPAPEPIAPLGSVEATMIRSSPLLPSGGHNPFVRIGGQVVPVGAGVVIGRDPAPVDDLPTARPVAVGDPGLSKTHLAIRAQGSTVEVCDLSSTNGTVVEASGSAKSCVAGVWRSVPTGATILAGDQRIDVSA